MDWVDKSKRSSSGQKCQQATGQRVRPGSGFGNWDRRPNSFRNAGWFI